MNSPMKRCILFLSAILLGVCGATDGWILHAESTAYEHEIRLTRARREAYQDAMSLRVRGVMEFKSVWDAVSAEARDLGKAVNTPVPAINIKASADELLKQIYAEHGHFEHIRINAVLARGKITLLLDGLEKTLERSGFDEGSELRKLFNERRKGILDDISGLVLKAEERLKVSGINIERWLEIERRADLSRHVDRARLARLESSTYSAVLEFNGIMQRLSDDLLDSLYRGKVKRAREDIVAAAWLRTSVIPAYFAKKLASERIRSDYALLVRAAAAIQEKMEKRFERFARQSDADASGAVATQSSFLSSLSFVAFKEPASGIARDNNTGEGNGNGDTQPVNPPVRSGDAGGGKGDAGAKESYDKGKFYYENNSGTAAYELNPKGCVIDLQDITPPERMRENVNHALNQSIKNARKVSDRNYKPEPDNSSGGGRTDIGGVESSDLATQARHVREMMGRASERTNDSAVRSDLQRLNHETDLYLSVQDNYNKQLSGLVPNALLSAHQSQSVWRDMANAWDRLEAMPNPNAEESERLKKELLKYGIDTLAGMILGVAYDVSNFVYAMSTDHDMAGASADSIDKTLLGGAVVMGLLAPSGAKGPALRKIRSAFRRGKISREATSGLRRLARKSANAAKDLLGMNSKVTNSIGKTIGGAESIAIKDAVAENARLAKAGYLMPPHDPKFPVISVKNAPKGTRGWRVSGGDSPNYSHWVMAENPLESTKQVIRDRYSIPDSNRLELMTPVDLQGESFDISRAMGHDHKNGQGIQIHLEDGKIPSEYKWRETIPWND